jgi:hypothetical protein
MKSRPDTLTAGLFALRRRTLLAAAAFAFALLVAGWFLKPDTRPGIVLLGLATSILAAVGLAFAAAEREEFGQRILDLGVQAIFDDRLKDLKEEWWTELLGRTKREFRVLGVANHGYLNRQEAKRATEAALQKALTRKGAEVEFLWLDPEHALAELREEEEKRSLRSDTCESIIFFWELREKLSDEQKGRFSMRCYNAVPTCGLSWADDYVVVTHYLAGQLNLRAPGIVLQGSFPWYERPLSRFRRGDTSTPDLAKKYTENFQEIAGDEWSRPVDESCVERLRELHTTLAGSSGEKRSEADFRKEEVEND